MREERNARARMKYALRALTSGRTSMAGPAAGNAVDLQTLNIAMHCTHTFERHVSSQCKGSSEGGVCVCVCVANLWYDIPLGRDLSSSSP